MRLDQVQAQTCRIVTRGRRTGAEHVVPVWFATIGTRFYAASRHGPTGDWLAERAARWLAGDQGGSTVVAGTRFLGRA